MILFPVFACCVAFAAPLLAEKQAEQPPSDHTRTWVTLAILALVLVLGVVVKAKVSRHQPPEKGAEP
jgi:hypothetical protein